jgi:hypothetical protein
MSKDKSWKDALLSSGIPLEQAIHQKVKSLGIDLVKEYSYQRKTEEGKLEDFSVDCYFQHFIDDLCLEYFVEAKYAYDNKIWIFKPQKFSERFSEDLVSQDLYITLMNKSNVTYSPLKFVDKALETISSHLCDNGIVIEKDKKSHDRHEIKRGIEQLRYALIHRTVELLKDSIFGSVNQNNVIILIPIIVTTAKIWRLKEIGDGIISSIKESEELSEIAEEKDYIVLFNPPNNENSSYSLSLFETIFKNEQDRSFIDLLKNIFPRLDGYLYNFIIRFHEEKPNYFIVVNYDYFSELIDDSKAFFKAIYFEDK